MSGNTPQQAVAPLGSRLPLPLVAGALAVLVGVPGSGKSHLAARYPASWRVCLDVYRELATDDMTDQSATPVAAQIQDLLLDARLARGLTTLVDATNIYLHVRTKLLARARYWQRPIVAVLFDVPLSVAHARNAGRERVVAPQVLDDLNAQMPTADQLLAEGFTAVYLASDIARGAGRSTT